MATFFGEIRPLSSRAVEDDGVDRICTGKLIFERTHSFVSNIQCDLTLFAVGKLAIAYSHNYLLSDDASTIAQAYVVPCVNNNETNITSLEYSKKKVVATLYYMSLISSKILICEINDNIPEELNFTLCQEIVALCDNMQEVLVLTSCHASSYKSSDSRFSEGTFLKCIPTSAYRSLYSNVNIPFLNPPNIIANFPAAIMSELEVKQQKGILLVCYTDVTDLNFFPVETFSNMLNLPGFQEKIKENSNAKEKLKKYFSIQNCKADNLFT